MKREEFSRISGRIADGIADEEEAALYNAYFNQYQLDYPVWENFVHEDQENVLRELKHRVDLQVHSVREAKQRHLWPVIAIAASVLLFFAVGLFYWKQQSVDTQSGLYANDVAPGKHTATLTLADGKEIALSETLQGTLAKESGMLISKNTRGQITYQSVPENSSQTERWNTLSTAKGETYQVNLADGTKIWLNAASSIRYMASVIGKGIRKVELQGEAYFEVAKDKAHPFIVKSNGQEVEVLGTEFNINSYKDEGVVKTTLLESAVRVNHQTVLKPNEQSVLSASGIKVVTVNADNFIDWKDDIFNFDQEALSSVMRKIARWYNIEIEYEGNFDQLKTFSGTIPRNKKLSEVLKVLEDSQGIHFSINGNKLLVKK